MSFRSLVLIKKRYCCINYISGHVGLELEHFLSTTGYNFSERILW